MTICILKLSWPSSNGIQSYNESKFEKAGNIYVPTCPIFTGPVTYVTRPAKTGHVGTNYIPSHNRSYLGTGINSFAFCNLHSYLFE